jgi:UDP-glucose 4-epimerase
MSKILVTGAAGYVGSICATQNMKHGHEVVAVDDLSTGHRESLPKGVQFYSINLGDAAALNKILGEHKIDAVFHFAAKALVGESMAKPALYFRTNVADALTMLECLRAAGVKKFVFSSTAAVYGNPATSPILEDIPKSPVNPYGESKLAFERILQWYASAYAFSAVAFRYFNACGATETHGELHDPETHIVPLLMQAASGRRKEFNVYGTDYDTPDGSCLRDYVHILDIADAHLLALQRMSQPGFSVFNIGTGTPYSVIEVCRVAEEVTGKQLNLKHAGRRPGDPAVLVASPQHIQKEFGWKASHSDLRSILESAWAWEQKLKSRSTPLSPDPNHSPMESTT